MRVKWDLEQCARSMVSDLYTEVFWSFFLFSASTNSMEMEEGREGTRKGERKEEVEAEMEKTLS